MTDKEYVITTTKLNSAYQAAQTRVRQLIEGLSNEDYREQPHPELSALGWHLAHCLYIENYWLREFLSADDSLTRNLDQLYLPEKSYKPQRGYNIPAKEQLVKQAKEYQRDNLRLISKLKADVTKQSFLTDNYLAHFILQHYDQHFETMQMALQQQALKKSFSDFQVVNQLNACITEKNTLFIEDNKCLIGSDQSIHYDNEKPAHIKQLNAFFIEKYPVSNQHYLAFMQDGGYSNQSYWNEQGWQWLQQHNIRAPDHWRQDKEGKWFGVNIKGAEELQPETALYGINYYEACAFANWAGARLPHEHEWECAKNKQLISHAGQVWEWCHNRFYPYQGFKAFPYDGYSTPWFDTPHFLLKGGSLHTQNSIRRNSFRNFFGPDKRHIFAGCRLVYDI